MGAKWLYQLRSAPGQQTSTLHLFDRFEALGAKKICKWSTQTTLCESINIAWSCCRARLPIVLPSYGPSSPHPLALPAASPAHSPHSRTSSFEQGSATPFHRWQGLRWVRTRRHRTFTL